MDNNVKNTALNRTLNIMLCNRRLQNNNKDKLSNIILVEVLGLMDLSCQIWECQMLLLDKKQVILSTFLAMSMFIGLMSKMLLTKVSKAVSEKDNEE